jgi:AcrR family transcriptional regulator
MAEPCLPLIPTFGSIFLARSQKPNYHHGDLRRAILEAAIEAIATQGIDSLTLRQLAQRVGVSAMAPYRHFENKSALIAAIAETGFEQLGIAMNEALAHVPADSLKRLQATGVAYVMFAVTHATQYRLMFGTVLCDRQNYPELDQTASTSFNVLVQALVECQTAKTIQAEDIHELATILWAQMHGLSMLVIDQQVPGLDLEAVEKLAQKATWTTIVGLKLD